MAIQHSNCSIESRAFCDDLLAEFQKFDATIFRSETSNCGFAKKGSNRFAYVYHKANTRLATIFLRGDEQSLFPPLSNGAAVQLREKLEGNWAKEFPLFIHLPVGSRADEVAALLLKFSLPLSGRKRKSKTPQSRLNDIEITDGKVRAVLSTQYERNTKSRNLCLQHFGYRCAGCDLLMAERYGKIAESLIHVHHLERLADTGERKIDPKVDLIPLCPNCHAVVHLRTPPLTIIELRDIIRANSPSET